MKLRIHLYHYDIDNNNSYCILYVYLYILVGEEYEGFPEEFHLQAFPKFVDPERRLESITALNNSN